MILSYITTKSGDSIGHTIPHCELCNLRGPNVFDDDGNGVDNLPRTFLFM